jgi:hypothetical protein
MKVKDHPEYLGVCGRIILERILETGWEEVKWIHVAGCCEHGNETSGSIKGGNFLTV